MKFYPTDWRSDPRLRMCGLAARGLWIEMIALMHEAVPYGHLVVSGHSPTATQLAVLAGAPSDLIPDLLGELESAGVFSRTKEGVIYSRKMTRMAKKASVAKKNGKNGGNPSLGNKRQIWPSDNQIPTDGVKPQKPEARYQKETEPIAQRKEAARAPDVVDRLLEAAGIRGNPHPSMAFPGAVLALVDAGLDLELDVLPAIRAKPNPRARTWAYFVPQIEDFAGQRRGVRQRIAALPPDRDAVLASWPAEKWAVVLEQWRRTGAWNGDAYGPKPGESGCRVPAELLDRSAA